MKTSGGAHPVNDIKHHLCNIYQTLLRAVSFSVWAETVWWVKLIWKHIQWTLTVSQGSQIKEVFGRRLKMSLLTSGRLLQSRGSWQLILCGPDQKKEASAWGSQRTHQHEGHCRFVEILLQTRRNEITNSLNFKIQVCQQLAEASVSIVRKWDKRFRG